MLRPAVAGFIFGQAAGGRQRFALVRSYPMVGLSRYRRGRWIPPLRRGMAAVLLPLTTQQPRTLTPQESSLGRFPFPRTVIGNPRLCSRSFGGARQDDSQGDCGPKVNALPSSVSFRSVTVHPLFSHLSASSGSSV